MYDELIRQFRDKAERNRIEGKPGLARDYTHAADAIDDLWGEVQKYRKHHPVISAANVVEVVRCADCRCFQINMRQDGYLPEGVPECECRWWCGEVDPTDYCSHAKRKDGGQDDGD